MAVCNKCFDTGVEIFRGGIIACDCAIGVLVKLIVPECECPISETP